MGRSTVRKGDYTDMWIAFHCQRVHWRFGTNSVTSNSTVYFIEPTSSAARDRLNGVPAYSAGELTSRKKPSATMRARSPSPECVPGPLIIPPRSQPATHSSNVAGFGLKPLVS